MATASDSFCRPRSLAGVGHGSGTCRTTGPPVRTESPHERVLGRRRRHGQERDLSFDQGEPPAHRRGRPGRRPGGGARRRRRPVGLFLGEQAAPGGVTVHGFSCSWRGASRASNFCRALKTRQRAVSSVRSSTSAISRNDSPCSARSSRAARNSGGSRPRARARSRQRFAALRPPPAGPRVLGRQVVGQRLRRCGPCAVLVGEVVVGDAKQPGGEVRARPEAVQTRERLEEGFLRQVLGRMTIVGQAVQPAI